MIFSEPTYIYLSQKKYPVKCDLIVLEKAQELYGSLEDFEKLILTYEPVLDESGKKIYEDGKIKCRAKWPSVKAVNDALYWMAVEGEYIMAVQEGRRLEKIFKDELIRRVDMPLFELADALHNEFTRCFDSKNVMTTQSL